MGSGSQGAQGAAGGAMAGAGLGTMVAPGIGTLIGAGVGGVAGFLGGYFGGDSEKDEYQALLQKLAAGYQGRNAPQMGPAAQAAASGLVGNRNALIAQLEAQARGEGPSAARLMMQQGADQANRRMTATAAGAGGRGVNQGAAMRTALGQGSAMNMQNIQNMGVMRAQEQLNAQSQLGQNINAGVNADNALSTWNAGQRNDQAALNAQLQMQQLGLNDRSQLQALMMASGMASPGIGESILAGGAQAMPGLMQMGMQRQSPQFGYMGAIGPQPGQPGWAASPMGQRQQALQNAYIQQNTPPAPGMPAPLPPNFMGTGWGGGQGY